MPYPQQQYQQQPTKPCQMCAQPANLIPAGISQRTGNPYKAFWSCKACGWKGPAGPRQIQPAFQGNQPFIPVPPAQNTNLWFKQLDEKLDRILSLMGNGQDIDQTNADAQMASEEIDFENIQ